MECQLTILEGEILPAGHLSLGTLRRHRTVLAMLRRSKDPIRPKNAIGARIAVDSLAVSRNTGPLSP